MSTYNIIYGNNIGKNCSTLVSARKQAVDVLSNLNRTFGRASIGILKDSKIIGHVLPTNSIFFVYQEVKCIGNPFKGYGPVVWINDMGKALTSSQANFMYNTYGLPHTNEFLW